MSVATRARAADHRRPDMSRPQNASRCYTAFGGVLRSELDFPELELIDDAPATWTLRIAARPPDEPLVALGERRVRDETYRVFRTKAGIRLEYSHAGLFDVSRDGSEIVWYPLNDARPELARTIVIGPILALALELSGHFCLHGSAIEVSNRGVAFVGPKHHGKSTLAIALTSAGARLIGDDTLAVMVGPPPILRPGIGSVRLWDDAARELRVAEMCDTVLEGIKTTASGFARSTIRDSEVLLGAVYVLEPVRTHESVAPASRVRIAPVPGAVALAHHAKLPDPLVGYAAAGARLRTAVSIASTVPIYTLRVARDFAMLPEAAARILDWHAGSPPPDGRLG